jgi:hypothetical protein
LLDTTRKGEMSKIPWFKNVEEEAKFWDQVKKLAEGAGKEPGALIRTWVLEHIKK